MDKARSDELFAKFLAPVTIMFFIGVAIYEANTGIDTSTLFMKTLGIIMFGSIFLAIVFGVIALFIKIIGRIFR
ncbi:MAG: hypothetical protein JKY50_09540 [Oleispira sp.]|nr:hypothetical protein [Oleispira sp.]